jgi:hypothetical protein
MYLYPAPRSRMWGPPPYWSLAFTFFWNKNPSCSSTIHATFINNYFLLISSKPRNASINWWLSLGENVYKRRQITDYNIFPGRRKDSITVKVNVKFIPVIGRGGSQGCETSWLPHFFLENRLTDGGKVVSLMCRRLFTPRKIPGTHFCQRLSLPQGHSSAGRIRSTGKSNDIGNRIRDLLACSIVPQPTTLSRAPILTEGGIRVCATDNIQTRNYIYNSVC